MMLFSAPPASVTPTSSTFPPRAGRSGGPVTVAADSTPGMASILSKYS